MLVGSAPAASAHGEAAQEAFLRMRTVAWINVNYSKTTVKQGETFTITGTAKILDAWPTNLAAGDPNTGYIGLIAPGPVVLLKERTINGVSAPSRIDVQRGRIYEFSMTVAGRRPGAGTCTRRSPSREPAPCSARAWITVEENPDGFSNPVTLEGGSTVNLENYQLTFTWIWLILTFLIGLAWMIYWTVPKRTVTNLAVTSQIPLNTDGMDYGLITKKDHRNMNLFAIGTALLLLAGWIYQAAAFPTKMPQQIFQFAPPTRRSPRRRCSPRRRWGRPTTTRQPDPDHRGARHQHRPGADEPDPVHHHDPEVHHRRRPGRVVVTPSATVAPGSSPTTLTLTMKDPAWEAEHLVPIGESQLLITGIMVFETADGQMNYTELEANLNHASTELEAAGSWNWHTWGHRRARRDLDAAGHGHRPLADLPHGKDEQPSEERTARWRRSDDREPRCHRHARCPS